MDLDLLKLRYFAAVAEHRHFGRAAEELYIAQPVLSRQIRALEQELGCALLTRTTRSVQLTPAGEQLREEARGVFATVDSAVRRVLEAGRGVERLVVAFAPGLHVSDAVRAFTATHAGVEIQLLRLHWWEQTAPLRDGRADVGVLRRPFDDASLRTVDLGAEAKVACMPATHPLARRRSLTAADLEGETILDAHARRTSSLEEKFELIAAGYGIAMVPSTVAESYSRPDLVHLPVTDSVPVETCVVVSQDRRERRVLDFVEIAAATLREQPPRLAAVD
ncbi:DNA-binding transcriptional LysR family regulator [Pseudonocardia sediminis]|uniref:DNA-binding transcriptional LysR family regulator n=1 Tax=Pseudonocardia sediminis TaxID=1397368 RepID=A0A4Q7V171_PSEST|nr:LysR substrate-binding domain-containing protein [Pseudonocardia sediminis]RZT86299.1 DNA-binding transcriptional LysR family regulator [Pseudonocardia sediminis]